MSKTTKVLLALTTVVPLVYIGTVLFVFSDFRYDTIVKVHYMVMAVYAVLLIVYLRDVRQNERLPDQKRDLWTALIFLGSSVAQLLYFWFYIWPEESEADHAAGGTAP